MKIERVILENQAATKNLGRTLAHALQKTPCLIFLSGDLGAGKTTFAQGFIQALIAIEHVASPTYAYMNQYDFTFPVYHFDLYRIDSPGTITELGLDMFLADDLAIRLVEWPERLPANFIAPSIEIHLETIDDSRQATIIYH